MFMNGVYVRTLTCGAGDDDALGFLDHLVEMQAQDLARVRGTGQAAALFLDMY